MPDQRSIVTRTAGKRHGPITRLMSPGDVGQLTRPFVFLDYIDAPRDGGPRFGFHPHSGIATLTFPLNFDTQHETSEGQVDTVEQGGIEWVVTGGGIWHKAQPLNGGERLLGFQLWLSLPPLLEVAPPSARFIQPSSVPRAGPVRVLLGRYGQAASPIDVPIDANIFWVQLSDGEQWSYAPPPGHAVGWAFAQSGSLHAGGAVLRRELAVFEAGSAPIEFQAEGDCGFLVGSAVPHPYELVLGQYSVHTSAAALAVGTRRIAQIGQQLRRDGLNS